MFALVSFVSTLSILTCLQPGLLDAPIGYELNFTLSCRSPITSHVIFSMLSILMPGIPSSAGPSSGPTNIWHFYLCVLILLNTHLIVCYLTDCMLM